VSDKRGFNIETETPKYSINHHSQVISAVTKDIARILASTLEQEREIVACFLLFQATREPPRKIQ
jgi:hypothetical protein